MIINKMDVPLKEYISTRISTHRLMAEKLYKETRELVERPAVALLWLKKYQPMEVQKIMQEDLDKQVAKANALDLLYNSEIVKAVKDARTSTLPDAVRFYKKPADYQAQINNALVFLNSAGNRLTDDEAFSILKPFFNDWELMRMFEKVVMRNIMVPGQEYADVRSKYPNTFGGILNIADAHGALFDEAEALAKNIFMHPKKPTMSMVVQGAYIEGAVVCDGYDSLAAQDRLLVIAEEIDKISANGVLNPAAFSNDYRSSTRAVEKSAEQQPGNTGRDYNDQLIWL